MSTSKPRGAAPPAAAQRPSRRLSRRIGAAIATVMLTGVVAKSWAHPPAAPAKHLAVVAKPSPQPAAAHGHVGYASYYARHFSGRKMADGTPMRPESDNAASRTLPLGSKAVVTNLRNGKTAIVTIRDRGPFIKGRIIDVSPSTARLLGMVSAGVVKVTVRALDDLPMSDKIDLVVAAADNSGPALAE